MNLRKLKKYADNIQDLGMGGKSVAKELILAAAGVKPGRLIIDIGPYIGSTTAYLGLGVQISGNRVSIISYDKWIASREYVIKAERHNGVKIPYKTNLKKIWDKNIKPFKKENCNIIGYKKDIMKTGFKKKNNIGLFVDDICNSKERFDHAMGIFSPKFIPGETILFIMDWGFFDRKQRHLEYQRDAMEYNKKRFLFLGSPAKSKCGIFLYLGGKYKPLKGDYSEKPGKGI